jgi:alpha-tubulin suppressor-like RCC1 family protein/tRNA A-37 threonylcarbamoyl transferase component Bud32
MSSEQAPAARAALDEHYEITRELGRGGTALVYLARERATGAEVAIKLIRAKYIEDEEAQARFAREARFVAQLNHPNIVPVRAVIDLGNSGIALVMAHVAGRTLKQVIRDDGPMSAARATQVMREVAGALGAAHAMGIIHRDVKPENIFIDEDGRAVLADFGLARSMTADTQLTMGGVAIGTPAYMAPEQIEGTELDARADVYSLGLVAWEMISGHRPWEGESLYAILYHQKHEILPDIRDLRTDMPDRLAEVIVRAIEKDRDKRWPSVHAVANALDESTPMWVSSRREPESADTTRFVRPPTPVATAVVAPPPQPPPVPVNELPVVADREEPVDVRAAVAPIAAYLEAQPPRPSRRVALIGGTASVLAVFVVIALVTAVMQGRSEDASRLTPDRSVRPTPAGDVAKSVAIGPPIDSTARTRTDSMRVAPPVAPRVVPRDTVSRLQGRPVQAPPVVVDSAPKRAAAVVVPPPLVVAPSIATAPTPPAVTSRVTIVGGGMHSCLVAADGRAFCWGNNDRGQLGNGGTARAQSPLLIGGDTRFVSVAAGLSHSCAIARGGAAWCWGSNEHGQLGDRSFAQRLAPVRAADGHAFRSIVAGSAHTCGLDADGVAWCWGSDAHGQLGDSSSRDSAVPVGVGTGARRFASLSAGWNFTCGLGTNGHASCWGENGSGQLGDGLTIDRHEPVPVASDLGFASLATGSAHACGVTTEGAAYCWGRNTNGQLGDGTTTDRTTPTRVRSNARFVSITAGAVHTCAVAEGGEAYCWGRNTYGQLGNGTTTDESVPTGVAGGHVFASLGAFGSHTCGATVSGEAFCCGYNLESQLGDGTRVHRTRPVYVETPGGR